MNEHCFSADERERWQDHPGVIAPPPVIVAGFIAVGIALDGLAWTVPIYEPVRFLGGGGLLIAGLSLMAAAMRAFRDAGTPIETRFPAATVVTHGPYAHTRNPIYVALLLAYAGVGVLLSAPAVIALLPLLFATLHFGVVRREEHYLECKFGDRYLRYRHSVPRWF